MTKEEIKSDFLAFADDDSEIIFESNGDVMFYINGSELICNVRENEDGNYIIDYQGQIFPYRTFIAKHLAKLDLFARKIYEKRKRLEVFVDSPATLQTGQKSYAGTALQLLQRECDNFLEFGSKINFITADAGHGKSILLKQFQSLQAERYINGESKYLFWHVDLQGRDLVRLGEAIMYDLGELRFPGLYYPSIIKLIQKKLIILAIDGFDELAAEIGGIKAVSSLSSFVNEMAGQGTLIAASRRTFFDTHDYLKRTSILKNQVPYDINFDELKLENWNKEEVIQYFDNLAFDDPENIYNAIMDEIHEEKHPILTRPFLLEKLAKAIEGDTTQVSSFFSREDSESESVAYIVEAFTKREVEKWKGVDNKTGQPYLSFDQHIHLLANLSKEMWDSKKDFVTIEEIELYTVLLFDEWQIEEDLRQIIVRIVGSHAFLIPVSNLKMEARKFDHDEFKHYFLARALANLINEAIKHDNYSEIKRFLYIDQLPDSVAMYCFNYVNDLDNNIHKIIKGFKTMVNSEWKPTYLQINIGTLFPFMVDKIESRESILFDSRVNYSSLIFENKRLNNIIFEHGVFTNISLRDTYLKDIHFKSCDFNEIKIEIDSKISFINVSFENTNVNSLILLDDGEIVEMAYAPNRIQELLLINGIKLKGEENISLNYEDTIPEKSEFKRILLKFLLKFNKMTIQYEKNIIKEKYLTNDLDLVLKDIIPLCEVHKVIESVETKQSKQAGSTAWRLLRDLEEILKHDGIKDDTLLSQFWKEVNRR